MSGFIKYMRSEEAEYLLSYPNANHLFMVMAYRARRTDHPMNGLKAGQCFLGDYSAIGLTERQYRTAKKQLTDWGLATFKGTNKGTVGTVLNTKVYDINEEVSDGQKGMQATDKGRASDGQATTNKECKKERKKEDNSSKPCKDKKDRLNYEELRNIYNENLTNAPEVQVITDSRKKKLKQFFEQFDLTTEKFGNYLRFINNHTEMKWAFERRPKNDGSGQYWNAKGFDYFISEKCFLKAKEDLQNDIR